ncbi:MAG: helix-turn-helix transcriptional regulator [Novosphingobium sp.]|nr:helix-turn-helix transcriptional regulator [Novosphingobium sp.]
MGNVVQLTRASDIVRPKRLKSNLPETLAGKFPTGNHPISADFADVAKAHGFLSYAVVDISERRGEHVFPRIRFHNLDEELGQRVAAVEDLTNCSVFLMLGETHVPFPFTTGLDCRTNEAPDPSLLDNQLDALLNNFGIRGGYCVPVCAPNSTRSVVMYFGPREEPHTRYPSLVLDTIESFDAIWHIRASGNTKNDYGLRPRELDCLRGLSEGKSTVEIGAACSLSAHTINAYLSSCVVKTFAKSVHEALFKARSAGLI